MRYLKNDIMINSNFEFSRTFWYLRIFQIQISRTFLLFSRISIWFFPNFLKIVDLRYNEFSPHFFTFGQFSRIFGIISFWFFPNFLKIGDLRYIDNWGFFISNFPHIFDFWAIFPDFRHEKFQFEFSGLFGNWGFSI